jgi:hypothetical protein
VTAQYLTGKFHPMRPLIALASALIFALPQPARGQIHPELVDSTWGRRTAAAWTSAWAKEWTAADSAFRALHREYPDALEAMIGLGFVARGSGHLDDARRWYRAALAAESSADVARQLSEVEWQRPFVLDLGTGSTTRGGARQSDWSASVVSPVTSRLALTARVGVLGGGDPLRGIFLDSAAGGGVRAVVVGGGGVFRPDDRLSLSARLERWSSSNVSDTYLWLDAAMRLTGRVTAHLAGRPVSGRTSAARAGGGVDILAGDHELSLDVMQGLRAAPFEARTALRLFDAVTLRRLAWRAGLVRELDPRLSATTGVVSGTWFATPTLGVRSEASVRRGAFAQSSIGAGLVVRR